MAVFNAAIIDTAPGSNPGHPFSPPQGWEGDGRAYRGLLRERWSDLKMGQRLRFCVSYAGQYPVEYRGPFSDEAAKVTRQIKALRAAKTAGESETP